MPNGNPQNFLYRNLALVVGPADLNGTAALTWRYRDAGRRDSTWSYVPALRRVRAVSPSNRSDGFLGSDTSQDDAQFFDAKVEDFQWTLAGQTDQLRLSEETNLKDQAKAVWVEGKGWDTEWPDV
ncbi:MAG: outer membrane lipoprotein-sorting protein, partial [Actinobacteria bacterium]|nr:outer membrane lipoprotein-sorting protein [Actinomycetota bacterium]